MGTQPISKKRKTVYYVGMALAAIGAISFASSFITFAIHFGDFSHFDEHAKSDMFRAFGGMFLIFMGVILMGIGRMGAAGAGIVLDPARAREDLKPWNQAAGGMLDDALGEVKVMQKFADRLGEGGDAPEHEREVIKVRCRACQALNEENAKYCDRCGAPV